MNLTTKTGRIIWKTRVILAIIAFGIISIPASIDMYITWGISRIFGREAKRRQTSVWRGRWGPIAWGTVRRILGVRVKDNFSRKKLPPCIVIANHTTHLDIILICAVLRIRGLLDTRWALKNSFRRKGLYVGHSCIASECAFLKRNGSEEDKKNIRKCAKIVGKDNVSYVIFPGGTRHSLEKVKDSEDFKHVLPPRPGGFSIIRKELPNYPILNLTFKWEQMSPSFLPSGLLEIKGELVNASDITDDKAWLLSKWKKKDAMLKKNK